MNVTSFLQVSFATPFLLLASIATIVDNSAKNVRIYFFHKYDFGDRCAIYKKLSLKNLGPRFACHAQYSQTFRTQSASHR